MSVHKSAQPTPPKDLDVSLILTIIDDAILENIGAEQARDEIVELVTAWSDQRTLAIIGEDEDLESERREFGEMSRSFAYKDGRNHLREQQRKALKADGGGDE